MDITVKLASQMKQHLKSMRRVRRLTQAELASKVGVTQGRIAEIESNPSVVSLEQLMRLLSAMDVELVLRLKEDSRRYFAAVEFKTQPLRPSSSRTGDHYFSRDVELDKEHPIRVKPTRTTGDEQWVNSDSIKEKRSSEQISKIAAQGMTSSALGGMGGKSSSAAVASLAQRLRTKRRGEW